MCDKIIERGCRQERAIAIAVAALDGMDMDGLSKELIEGLGKVTVTLKVALILISMDNNFREQFPTKPRHD